MLVRIVLSLLFVSLMSSCLTGDGTTSIEFLGERGTTSGSTTPISNALVSNVTLNSNNELVITGSNLNIVDAVKITGPSSYNQAFQIKSKTATQLIIGANTTFAVNALLNLIFTNATGAATHTINFALADASVTGAKLATGTVGVDRLMNGSTVGTNEFLKWDGSKFVGEAIGASQVMLGDWNADTNRTSTSGFTQAIADNCVYDGGTANNGEYFVVTTADPAQPIDGISAWAVKDWIMCSSSNWIKITRTSVSDNSDVDTSGSTSGGILYFNNNNARWEATGEVSVTVGTVVEFANDVKVGNLAGGGVRCIQVDNNGQLQAASCATANTGIDGGSGGSVSATSGDVTVVAANNKTVTTTVGGSTIVQVDQAGMSMNGYTISNVATPTSDQEVANKGYVDAAIAGAGADDLGNHTATQNLNLSGFNITNPGLINGVDINSVTTNTSDISANALLLGGRTLTTQAPNSGQVLKWDGSKWAPGNDNSGSGGGIVWTATGPEQIHSSRLTDTNNTIASLSSTITANQTAVGVLNNSVTTLEAAGQWSKSSSDILYLTGNVGIGTTDPEKSLHVSSTSPPILSERVSTGTNNGLSGVGLRHTTSGDMVDDFGVGVTFKIQDSAAVENNIAQIYAYRSGADNSGRLEFGTSKNGSTGGIMTMDEGGKVGIGTTSPTVKLEIAVDIDSSAPVGGLGCAFNGITCNCNTNYTFHDNDLDGLVDAGECYERSIYSKGTIGLGTTDPKAKLHIQQGHAIFESNLNAPNGSLLVFEKSRGAAVVQDQDELGVIDFYGTSSAPAYTRAARIAVDVDGSNINATQIPGQINFYTDDGSVSASGTVQRMVIKSTGEVGIGLNNPMAQLGVNGELGLTEMAVDPTSSSGWGKLFVSQADNKLYYMSEAGVKTDLLSGGGGGTPTTNSVSSTEIINYSITGTDIATNTIGHGNLNFASSDGLAVPTLASSPSVNALGATLGTPDVGFTYYNSTSSKLEIWNGTSFDEVGGAWDHSTTTNIILGDNWISGDGDAEGMQVDADGNIGFGIATNSNYYMNVRKNLTHTSGAKKILNYLSYFNPTANGSGYATGVTGQLQSSNGNNVGEMMSMEGVIVSSKPSGTLSNAVGVRSFIRNTNAGTISNAHGLVSDFENSGAGLVSIFKGLEVTMQGGGPVTNGYGVYIATMTATNSYAIYSEDVDAASYFAGNIGIGTTNPEQMLQLGATAGVMQAGNYFGAQLSGDDGGRAVFGSNLYVDENNNLKSAGNHASYGYSGVVHDWGDIYFMAEEVATVAGATVTPTAKMVIKDTGRVGIGTITPASPLHVHGDSGNVYSYVTTNGDSSGDRVGIIFGRDVDGTPKSAMIGMAEDDSLRFSGLGNLTTNVHMVINNSGEVGVGTTLPISPFDLNNANPYFTLSDSDLTLGSNPEKHWALHNYNGDFRIARNTHTTNPFTSQSVDFLIDPVGNIGIGTTTPKANLDISGMSKTRTLSRTVPTTLNNAVDIGTFALDSGASDFDISIVVADSGFSVAKSYRLPIQYRATNNIWKIANPIASTGPYTGDDFELEMRVNNATFDLRIRRSLGSTPGNATIIIREAGDLTNSFTPSLTEAGVTAATETYSGSPISQSGGNVGIGTSAPTAKLEVQGAIVTPTVYNTSTATIDWAESNVQSLSAPTGNTITVNNMLNGGSYTLAVTTPDGSNPYTFSSGGLTFKFKPANGTTSGETVYTFIRIGNTVYVSWITGF